MGVRLSAGSSDALADLAKAGDALGAARVDTDGFNAARAEDPFVAGQVPLTFAIRDSRGHVAAQRLVAGRVVRTQWLFDPGQPELFHGLHAADSAEIRFDQDGRFSSVRCRFAIGPFDARVCVTP